MKEFIKRVVHRFFALVFFVIYFPVLIFSQDTTDGIVWEPPIQLTDTSYSAYMPKIALSGDDTIHVTWGGGKLRIPYASSIDGGINWNLKDLIIDTVTYPYPFLSNLIVAQDQNVYMFSANEPMSQTTLPRETRMHKSTNGGISWSLPFIIGDDSSGGLFSANINKDTLVLVYSPEKNGYSKKPMMIVSTDAGETWQKRPDTLDGWTRTALTPGTLHLVRDVFTNGAQEKLYLRSTDLGSTWEKAETLSTVDGKFAIEHCIASNKFVIQSPIFVAWRDAIACDGMVGCTIISRETYNNGNDWTSPEILTEEPRGYNPSAAISDDGATAVAWTSELLFVNDHVVSRIRKHPDSSWSSIVDHTPTSRVGEVPQVAITSRAVHLVWTQSVGEGSNEKFCTFYRRGIFLTTNVREEKNNIPDGYSLSQNYPNPFNPSTKLSFVISHSSLVSVKVYDVFGREVTALVNEKKQPGRYEVEWTPSTSSGQLLSSGVYFIRMNAGTYFSTIKAILMK
jgi:hypothetical protein